MLKEGANVTTRYFGGYESVRIISFENGVYLVARFGGQATDLMPADKIEKVIDDGTRH